MSQQQRGSRFREGTDRSIILVPDVVNENEFLLSKKRLSMKDVFSVENRILDSKYVPSLRVPDITNLKHKARTRPRTPARLSVPSGPMSLSCRSR